MDDSDFRFDDAEPVSDSSSQDAMETIFDGHKGSGSGLVMNGHVKRARLRQVPLTGSKQVQNGNPVIDSDDNYELEAGENDDEDSEDYEEADVERKRKRVRVQTPDTELSHSKATDARIKAEGGESFLLDEDADLLAHHENIRVVGTFGRHGRRKGEALPAYYKRVSANLDSDDQLMLDMREKGYSDRQISEKLAKDGRIRYDPKSISTRIMRIRLAQAENFDFLLAEGYREWELEDDQRLAQAYALADIEISYEIERVRAWRFRKVSDHMRHLDRKSNFSANACRVRYGQLTAGTACVPCEEDDDPDTRREELEVFRLSREAKREKEAAEKETRMEMEKRVKDEIKIKNAQKAEETANKRAAKEQEKADRALQRAAQAQLRMQKAAENQKAKTERNAQIQKAAASPKKRGKKAKPDTDTDAPTRATSSKAKSLNVPEEGLETVDPRSYLNMADLTKLCIKRGLPTDQTKKDLVASLTDADMEWNHNQLRQMCKAKNLGAGGTKAVMRYQLALKEAQSRPSFEAGMRAAQEANDGDGDEMIVDAE